MTTRPHSGARELRNRPQPGGISHGLRDRLAGPAAPTSIGGGLTPVAQTEDWPACTPAAERVDDAALARLVWQIRAGAHGGTNTSLLIARHGRLIVEAADFLYAHILPSVR